MRRLFIPGPTDVHPDVLAAQNQEMIGHRGREIEDLLGGLEAKARQVFFTHGRVLLSTSSGTGLQEAGIRNGVAAKVLCCVNGAFSQRWAEVAEANGKEVARLTVEWGRAILPEMLARELARGGFDAVTIVHNETSTGVVSPVREIAALVRDRFPDVTVMVDAVSSLGGDRIEFDSWGLDVLLTSTQKCLAAPPGLSLAAVSDRVIKKAATVPHRGLYFDFVEMEKFAGRRQTPATPAISLMWALDAALDRVLAEGLDARFARHALMAGRTQAWARERSGLFAEAGFESRTVTCLRSLPGVETARLIDFLRSRGMQISGGYGPLKTQTFRIAHMGEATPADLEALFAAIEEAMEKFA